MVKDWFLHEARARDVAGKTEQAGVMGACDLCGSASGAGRKGDAQRSEQNRPPKDDMDTYGEAGCPLDAEQTWGHRFLVA